MSITMSIREFGLAKGQLSKTQTWVTFWAMFFFATIWMFANIEPTSVMLPLALSYGFNEADMGNIMTFAGLAGLIISLPAAWFIRKIGVKATCLVTAVVGIIGTLVCAIATSVPVFLTGRFIIGLAFGIAAIIGPNAMPRLFPVSKLGNAMGIWSLWVTPGTILSFGAGPAIFEAFGSQGLMTFCVILEIVFTVVMLVFVKMPAVALNTIVEGNVEHKRIIGKQHTAWAIVVAISFALWCTLYAAFNNFYATYLTTVQGMTTGYAGIVCLCIALFTIPAGFIFGRIIDKYHLAKHFIWIGYLVVGITVGTFAWQNEQSTVTPWITCIIVGFFSGAMVPIGTRTIIPLLAKDPAKTDYSLGIMGLVTQVANITTGSIFAPLFASVGFYHASLYMLVPIAAVAVVIFLFCPSDKKLYQEELDAQTE